MEYVRRFDEAKWAKIARFAFRCLWNPGAAALLCSALMRPPVVVRKGGQIRAKGVYYNSTASENDNELFTG